jgi:hypothetical protein
MNSILKYSLSLTCLALMAVPVVGQDGQDGNTIGAVQASANEKFQVLLLQSSSVMNGSFAFGDGVGAIPGMTSGSFGAELEGQVLLGQFADLNFGSASIWMAQAGNEQFSLMASGLKSEGFLFGQATVIVDGIPGNTFLVVGQAVPIEEMPQEPVATVPTTPTTSPSPLSAQPDTGPFAPDARPSVISP